MNWLTTLFLNQLVELVELVENLSFFQPVQRVQPLGICKQRLLSFLLTEWFQKSQIASSVPQRFSTISTVSTISTHSCLAIVGGWSFFVTSKANKAKTQNRDEQCLVLRHGHFQTKTKQTEREAKTKADKVSQD